ncbi:glycoside hydrolase N-terminal domain-containing protein [Flavihumibacter sp. RY-1]|uniref:Glycoside hydrolase N-terminal domain-containing protein n=1 Tax=Flavihumibacter fluminis TaxID=2909236 RepID=A0ABS9BEY9_9BACT|nr:glycoside hydrolase family 95 protein [Flavihumibacter fluminis]MCF1713703.1 glycoside hydrolase N-terminal domain-containing protein [Flavihumibacter fluminis]
MIKPIYSFCKAAAAALCFFVFGGIAVKGQEAGTGLRLWYKKPARDWNEALPVGNGRMGAMVFGDAVRERIQLNEESLWAGSKVEADADGAEWLPNIRKKLLEGDIRSAMELSEKGLKSDPLRIRSYQPVGDIYIDFFKNTRSLPELSEYRRELDLGTGIARTEYSYAGIRLTREVFASAVDNIIVVRLSSSVPGKLTFRLSLNREQDASVVPSAKDELLMQGQVLDLPAVESGPAGPHMKFAARVWGMNKGGSLQAINNSIFVEGADEAVFYLTAATDYNFEALNYDRSIDPARQCAAILEKARQRDYASIKQDHIREHSAIFNRLSLSLGQEDKDTIPTDLRLKAVKEGKEDKGLAVLQFQYGRYLLMGSSRKPGVLPANLQGIWNKDMEAAWNSDFHTNINLQMNYWPADNCNLSELFQPFTNLTNKLRGPGRITASKTFQSKGWTVNHLTDVFGRTAIADGVGWGTFPMGGPWMALQVWDHYLFTRDRQYLEQEAWPIIKESAEFVLGFLVKDKNGQWVTAPSNSPENTYRLPNGEQYMLTYGATMDIQIITALVDACLEAGKLLGEDKVLLAQWEKVRKELPPVRVSKRYGTIQEWIEDYEEVEPGHRHISHLFGLYPAAQITPEQPELFEAARKTIERRHQFAEKGQGFYTGWSKAWSVNMYARLLDGDAAWKNILDMQRYLTLPNLFDNHPPFQIDGNFGFTAGVAEMLLQSHNGLHFLPALPNAWKEGDVKGLKARGNILVDISWQDGQLQEVKLVSPISQKVRIKYGNLNKTVVLKEGKPFSLNQHLLKKK